MCYSLFLLLSILHDYAFRMFLNHFLYFLLSDPRIREDRTSIFSYEGETLNTVQGSTSDSTGLKLRAKIYIIPLGACKYRMQVRIN